jgi:peptidoglycan/LPS O-acetylase OafA/YrhL
VAGRVKELDGLRAVAVSMVVLGHCNSVLLGGGHDIWLPFRIIGDGFTGVLIFFVLSGFLITRILLAEIRKTGTLSLTRFYWHRAVRILPASYTYIIVTCIIAVLGIARVSVSQIVTAALHMWNYKSVLGVAGPPQGEQTLGHFWSLALEEQFYWVWPILILLISSHRPRFLIAVILAMPVVRVVSYVLFPDLRDHLSAMFHTAIDPIAMGALLACFEDRAAMWASRVSSRMIAAIVTLLFIVAPLMRILLRGMWTITYGATIESAAAAALIALLAYRPDHWTAKITRLRPFQYVGMISFSLYLWQQMFCIKGAPFESPFYISVPAALVAASVSFYAIERPTRGWRNLFSASLSAKSIDKAAASLQK